MGRTTRVGIAVVAAALLAACGGQAAAPGGGGMSTAASTWDEVLKKASEEGTVSLYSALLPEVNKELETRFEKTYPDIDLKITRIVGPEVSAKLDAELKSGSLGADIVNHVNYEWAKTKADEGLFAEPVGPNGAGPEWKGTPYLIDDVLQTSALTALGIAWNTEKVTDPPATYEGLVDPKYGGGRLGLVDNLAAPMADLYAWLEDTYGADYLTKLAALKPKFYPSAVPLQEALLSGEISIALWGANSTVKPIKASGGPIDWLMPDPGWAPMNLGYMFKESDNPNAAQVLFDFMASAEGQESLAKDNLSVLPNVAGAVEAPKELTLLDLTRATKPGWLGSAQSEWKQTFGR